jgi:hypothetical protein
VTRSPMKKVEEPPRPFREAILSTDNRQYDKLRSCEKVVLGLWKAPEGRFSGWYCPIYCP